MSIRLRLTLLYSGIVALAVLLFGVMLYLRMYTVMLGPVETALETEAATLIQNRKVYIDPISRKVYVILPANEFKSTETFVQGLSGDGDVEYRSDNLYNFSLSISDEVLEGAKRGKPMTEIVLANDGDYLLIYNKPVKQGGKVAGILQMARSVGSQLQTLATARKFLITGGIIITLLSFGIGWLLAGLALRPINRITQTAQAIGIERDFGRRVNYRGPHDEIGRLATTFNTMLAALQAAYQAQRRFVADASHELRTPLTTIRGNIGLLRREPPINDEDRRAVLSDMADETERLSRLVNDLLMLARADAGRTLDSEPVAVKPLIVDLCRNAGLLDPLNSIDCEDVADVYVTGDRDALKQVLLILLDNALKYTPDGGTITMAARVADGNVAMSVCDTGPGIDPEILPHIFERFYQADTARTTQGTGLGLAIAKALVDAQHGDITVESHPGQGSTFTVTLPQAPASVNPAVMAEPVGTPLGS